MNKHVDDSVGILPIDDVWIGRYHRKNIYTISEVIKAHLESHHPTLYNFLEAPLIANIELNMQGEKKTRFLDNFQRIASIPHAYDHGEQRTILFFAKTPEVIDEAKQAGATLAGDTELIKEIQNGKLQLSDYQYILAHPNILSELVVLRGLMKKRFPGPKQGTLGVDVEEMVKKYLNGIQYTAIKDEFQKDFGLIQATVGKLNMDPQKLEANIIHLLQDVNSVRPRREGRFITRCYFTSPPSGEKLFINPFLHVAETVETVSKEQEPAQYDSDDEEEKREASA